MNKFDALNIVTISDLAAQDKALLTELILRSDENWYSWPSVQRLCMARGIKHEKNFKGADVYLPGIVTKVKRGRRMTYTLDIKAIRALDKAEVTIKHTTPLADTPALEGVNTPAVADNTPAQEGANTSKNTTEDSSSSDTFSNPTSRYSFKFKDEADLSKLRSSEPVYVIDLGITTTENTPAQEGVLEDPRAPWMHKGVLYQTKAEAQAARDKDAVMAGWSDEPW